MTIPYYNPNLLLWVVVGIVVRLVVCTSSQEDPTVGTLTSVLLTGDQPTAHVVLFTVPSFRFS